MKTSLARVSLILTTLILLFSWGLPVQAKENNQNGMQPAANSLPVITVWYESSLKFSQIGNPQTQINILGNVSDTDGTIQTLTYRLNGRPAVSLSIGPNTTRLINPGDFNAALNTTDLLNGANSLLLTSTDNNGGIQSKTVTFMYTRGNVWPLPYSTHWSSAASIQDQAQVVDGQWQIGLGGIHPTQFGYDRLVAIGDVNWTNYEVLVPVTVRAFYPDPSNPGDAGGVGMITRWQGHIGPGQPPSDWTQLGAYGYYSNRTGGLALRLNANSPITQSFAFQYNTTYLFKMRAETVAQGGRYSFKVWKQGQPEPDWSSAQFSKIVNVIDGANDLLQGSALLVAHRVDATFGDATVCPLNGSVTYPLTIKTNGSGSVSALPNKPSYACGEGVTLTAVPSTGWVFKGWTSSPSLPSPNGSLSFNMTQAYTVTANFQQGLPVNLNNHTYLPLVAH